MLLDFEQAETFVRVLSSASNAFNLNHELNLYLQFFYFLLLSPF